MSCGAQEGDEGVFVVERSSACISYVYYPQMKDMNVLALVVPSKWSDEGPLK